MVLGTGAYMSPQQARGAAVDYRSDQFALGVIVHEMLSGKQPFRRYSMPETMTAVRKEDAPQLEASVPAPLRCMVERLLEKEPEERYSSTKDLFRELRTLRERLGQSQSNTTRAIPVAAVPKRATGRLICGCCGSRRSHRTQASTKRFPGCPMARAF